MKQYVIDQLRESDYENILDFLKKNADSADYGDIFWVKIPEELYSGTQKEHTECQPFWFAVNLSLNQVDFELLIRTREKLRCSCIAYADHAQRDYIIGYADGMLEKLGITI
jgi:hypothetical protein